MVLDFWTMSKLIGFLVPQHFNFGSHIAREHFGLVRACAKFYNPLVSQGAAGDKRRATPGIARDQLRGATVTKKPAAAATQSSAQSGGATAPRVVKRPSAKKDLKFKKRSKRVANKVVFK